MKTKLRKSIVSLLVICLLLSLCPIAMAANDPTKVVIGVAAEPDAFFICHSVNGTNMDECPVIHNIYDTLVRRNPDGTYTGLLATEWSVSDDGLSYTFKIRPGVKFSDGSDLTLEDIVFSLNTSAASKAGQAQLLNYDYAEAVGEDTVVVHLKSAYAGFINAIVNRYGLIFSKSYYEKVGEDGYNDAPIGTGPYKFVEHVSGAHVKVTANEHYWGEKPAITDVVYRVVSDINTQMIALENKEIDVLLNANISPLLKLDPNGQITYQIASSAQSTAYTINTTPSQATADINLRKAIAYAINREEINFGAYENMTTIATCGLPYGFNGRPEEGTFDYYTFDWNKAKEYLAASNYNGAEVKIVTIAGTKDEIVSQIVQGQLINLGINCTLAAVDAGTYNDYINNSGDYALALRSSSSSLMDADMYSFAFKEDILVTPKYDRGWSEHFTTTMKELLNAGRIETEMSARQELYRQATQLLFDECIQVPVVYGMNVVAYNRDLAGIEPSSLVGIYYIYDWSWTK